MEMDISWFGCFVAIAALLLPLLFFFFKLRRSGSSNISSPQSESVGLSSLPSASGASQPLPKGDYEVFLSFRGPDTRNNITDFLYNYLERSKIRTFRDDDELRKGEKIGSALIQAINQSKIYIVVFSPNYASSKWCLQELAKMVECCKEDKGHVILPIFFYVDPRDVRHQTGPYQKAFEQYKKQRYPDVTIQEWKESLKEVGQMKGWHVTDSDGFYLISRQGAIVDEVFGNVSSLLNKDYALLTEDLVGIDHHVEAVVKLLSMDLDEGVKTVGIHGMGGIGKTTIAMAVYDKVSMLFDGCCFLEDVREKLQEMDGAVSLQNKLISSVIKGENPVTNVSEGIHKIKNRVGHIKALIVLDDVDSKFEFEKLLGQIDNFYPGSRFIITTRDKKVLNLLKECESYEAEEMSHDHSLLLFCKHAFRMEHPPADYATLSEKFAVAAAGLPLALKVLGSLLYREDREVWEEKLVQLKEISPTEVQKRLEISYKTLTYEEQQIFLDIACFFIGEDKDIVSYMWSSCKFYPISGINTLILRSLIKVERDKFKMHDQLRDLGRSIVREENFEHPWKRSRVWSSMEAVDMLNDGKGSKKVQGLEVYLKVESAEQQHLTGEQFRKLSELRYLGANCEGLKGDFQGLVSNLRYLNLKIYKGDSRPTTFIHPPLEPSPAGGQIEEDSSLMNFHPKKLAVLDLSQSTITDYWDGWAQIKAAKCLKVLDLKDCMNLTRVPDLSEYENLEVLNLQGCFSMVHELRIGNFKNLKILSLSSTRITKLSVGNGMLQKLVKIGASGCFDLDEIVDIGNLPSLTVLIMTGNRNCKQVPDLPTSLQVLVFSHPVPNLLELRDLQHLIFRQCNGVEIPGDIWKLSKLKTLTLQHATFTSPLGALPSSLTKLDFDYCPQLVKLPNLGNLENLIDLRLSCPNLVEIEGLGELKSLIKLSISNAPMLNNVDGLENLQSLAYLTMTRCLAMQRLPSLANLKKMDTLIISGFPNITEIEGLGELDSLQAVRFDNCTSLQRLHDMSKLTRLKSLSVGGCQSLMALEGLEFLTALERLELTGTQLERLPSLSKLAKLKSINLQENQNLREIVGIENMERLETLWLAECTSLETLPDLSGLKKLKELNIRSCVKLTEVRGIEELKSLENLEMKCCKSIEKLPNLSNLGRLSTLSVWDCERLTELAGVEELKSLTNLYIFGCKSLRDIPPLPNVRIYR
ncbi:Disease resistance protein L6 [Linum perenne]